MAQAREIAERLQANGHATELVPMTTSGDRNAPPDVSAPGMKGLFVAEIVRALQDGDIDLAVHSAKDLPSEDPAGIQVAAVPERGSPWDVLLTRGGELLEGATVGSASLRRQGQLLRWRPDLSVVGIRGNVDTRLRKLSRGEVDALVLAAAGLARLGIVPEHTSPLGMLPAPGQGALAVQARVGDAKADIAREIDDPQSHQAFEAERKLVERLGGGCSLPLGAFAVSALGVIALSAAVFSADGVRFLEAHVDHVGSPGEAAARVADDLLAAGAGDILEGPP